MLTLLLALFPVPSGMMTDLVENTDLLAGERPLIRSEHPSFSWFLESQDADVKQTAYRILVSGDPSCLRKGKADIWDSGKVRGPGRLGVVCGGTALEPGREYWWAVNVRTRKGWSGYRAPAHFRTADVL